MFRIGEFSKLMQISIRMLRHYDEMGLFKPAEIEQYTGYRLYSIKQIPILQKIILLRDVKFSVAEIKIAIENWDDDFMIQQLENKKQEIQAEIRRDEQRIDKIKMAITDFKEDKIDIHYNISFKNVPSIKIVSLRKIIPSYQCEGLLWGELYQFIEREHIEILPQNNNNLAIYHDEGHKEADVDVEVGLIVKRVGENKQGFIFRETEKIATMACMMVYGPYENIGSAYEFFAYWLAQHKQYKMTGLSRQVCHRGPYEEKNPNHYLTEIQTPVVNIFH